MLDEELSLSCDFNNEHDRYTVVIMKNDQVVGMFH